MSLTKEEVLDRRKDHAETLQRIETSITDIQTKLVTPEGKAYVEMAMKREARKEVFRQAVIEKTITSLVWSGIVGAAMLMWHGFKDHLK